MGSKMVRLEEGVYEHIRSRKRADETFSDAIDRLTGGYTLIDFAEEDPVIDPERHSQILEERDAAARRGTDERLEEMANDVD